jgi:isopenicillin N synthase-like dioxygenase
VSVPTIDLSGGAAGVADDVRRACEDVGFLTVLGHGIDLLLIEEVGARSRAFFDLPEAESDSARLPTHRVSPSTDRSGPRGSARTPTARCRSTGDRRSRVSGGRA